MDVNTHHQCKTTTCNILSIVMCDDFSYPLTCLICFLAVGGLVIPRFRPGTPSGLRVDFDGVCKFEMTKMKTNFLTKTNEIR